MEQLARFYARSKRKAVGDSDRQAAYLALRALAAELVGSTLVVDTPDHAGTYRTWVQKKGRKCPKILSSFDASRLAANGERGGRAMRAPPLRELQACFGSGEPDIQPLEEALRFAMKRDEAATELKAAELSLETARSRLTNVTARKAQISGTTRRPSEATRMRD